jgi:sulfur-carrier protein
LKLQVLYFANLRESVGLSREQVELPLHSATVGQLRNWLAQRGAPWNDAFAPGSAVRSAVDQVLADDTAAITDGSEVAFFPPVTGG